MKASLFVIITLVIALACSSAGKDHPDPKPPVAKFGLALDSAIIFANTYDTLARKVLHIPTPIRGFTIHTEDLLEAIGATKENPKGTFDRVRIYIGIDPKGRFRAFLTPVRGATRENPVGYDSIYRGPYKDGWVSNDNKQYDGDYVLDFTMPCPNSCDKTSKILHDTLSVE